MTRRLRALSLLALAAPVLALSAQQPAKPGAAAAAAAAAADSCPIELMQPTGLGIANLQRPKLAGVKSVDDANKVMRDVSKLLFDDKQKVEPDRPRPAARAVRDVLHPVRRLRQARRHRLPGRQEPVRRPAQVRGLAVHDHRERRAQVPGTPRSAGATTSRTPIASRRRTRRSTPARPTRPRSSRTARMILNHSGPQPYDVLWRVAKLRKDEAKEISVPADWRPTSSRATR